MQLAGGALGIDRFRDPHRIRRRRLPRLDIGRLLGAGRTAALGADGIARARRLGLIDRAGVVEDHAVRAARPFLRNETVGDVIGDAMRIAVDRIAVSAAALRGGAIDIAARHRGGLVARIDFEIAVQFLDLARHLAGREPLEHVAVAHDRELVGAGRMAAEHAGRFRLLDAESVQHLGRDLVNAVRHIHHADAGAAAEHARPAGVARLTTVEIHDRITEFVALDIGDGGAHRTGVAAGVDAVGAA